MFYEKNNKSAGMLCKSMNIIGIRDIILAILNKHSCERAEQ